MFRISNIIRRIWITHTKKCLSEYIDCVKKLQDTRLPPRDYFSVDRRYNIREQLRSHRERLTAILHQNDRGIQYICTWKFVLLLADIFENFRNSCASYGLDPAHYYIIYCQISRETPYVLKIRVANRYWCDYVIEHDIRGGLSQYSGRHAG